ncbi:MAG: inositol oxygenase [Armatimonadetes bacterium]|nr:inositol oxygenase [Armatimonadota bacterium]MDE2205029.1 inositol oxygenase [Armatimonadota bacterium]
MASTESSTRQNRPVGADFSPATEGQIASSARQDGFRDYAAEARASVREFYRANHQFQTLEFVLRKKAAFLPPRRRRMSVWEAMEFLDTLVDDSDPDTELSQIAHLMQTAEAIRNDGHPRWFVLTGLIHDLGKVLCLFGEPQWAVVGDTFPVGCAFSPAVIYHEFFADNPDATDERYNTELGIYQAGCGLDQVHLSWGHDEYLYQVVKGHLPEPALAMIRYHSFYAAHKEGAYTALMSPHDLRNMDCVRAFNSYDLYSKSAEPPDVERLRPWYQQLIAEYFPEPIDW